MSSEVDRVGVAVPPDRIDHGRKAEGGQPGPHAGHEVGDEDQYGHAKCVVAQSHHEADALLGGDPGHVDGELLGELGEPYIVVRCALRNQRRQERGLGTHGPDQGVATRVPLGREGRQARQHAVHLVVVHAGHHCAWLTEDMWKSGMRSDGIFARVAQSPHSLGSVTSLTPASVARRSRSSGLSLKRKLLTAPVT